MSTLLCVHSPTMALPNAEAIVSMLAELGISCAFPEGFAPGADSGLIPCTLNGQAAGFEFLLEQHGQHPQAGCTLTFESRSSALDYAAAALVAAAVARCCDGRLIEDEDLPTIQGDALLDWARAIDVPSTPATEAQVIRVPVTVVGPRGNNLLQLKLGRVKSAVPLMTRLIGSIDLHRVPPDLRLPNSRFTILVHDGHEIVGVER
jgi:hypothetical protein